MYSVESFIAAELQKKREKILRSIDTLELTKRIKHFQSINLHQIERMNEEELHNAINNVLLFNGSFLYLINGCDFKRKHEFFRVRKINQAQILQLQDFWEAPAQYVTKRGRLNRAFESLLYVSASNYTIPFQEVPMNVGDTFMLIKYLAIKSFSTIAIGGNPDYKQSNIYDQKAIKNHNLIHNFLINEFRRTVNIGEESFYRISEKIVKDYFDMPIEINGKFDEELVAGIWTYPSIKSPESLNVCFRPHIAHQVLCVQNALIGTITDSHTIDIHHYAIPLEKENIVPIFEVKPADKYYLNSLFSGVL